MADENTENLTSGNLFGHYLIVKQIGAGGRGEVYLAEDTQLERWVAIKILNEKFAKHESNLQRFMQEAKAVSALNHPNILVIHEIGAEGGTHYIVSEFIEGKTLRDFLKQSALKLSEILNISIQIAHALVAAHEEHLVHRDIKPENIMIRPDGVVKILDFGLAKLVEQKVIGSEESTVKQNQTAKGLILGTVNYMSPEQAKGKKVDERTDLFSFGVVIYEMIAGRTPFAGESVSETISNLINIEPHPLSRFAANVPDELQRIVSKMLRKDKNGRYQTIKGLLADLKDLRENLVFDERLEKSHTRGAENETKKLQAETGDTNLQTPAAQGSFTGQIKRHKPLTAFILIILLTAVGLGIWYFTNFPANAKQIESIAVLPLENLSGDASQDYFADGMTEAMITELAKIENLRVISRNSTIQYKGTDKKVTEIASELNVDAVVVGTVFRSNNKVRISTQLYRSSDDQNVWSNSYEHDMRDVITLLSEVSRGIVSEIKTKLSSRELELLTNKSKISPEATDAFFRGRYYFYQAINSGGSEDETLALHEKSFYYLRQAIAIEPNYADAYTALAASYHWLASSNDGSEKYNSQLSEKYYPQSIEAANKAIQIDETNALAHQALAFSIWNYDWNIIGAEKEYLRAIELDPDHRHGGYAMLLSSLGRHDEAIGHIIIAERSDPLNVVIKHLISFIYENARQYDKAIEQCRYVISLNPAHPGFQDALVVLLTHKGMYREAIAETQKLMKMTGREPGSSLRLAWVYAMTDQREKAISIINNYKSQPEENWNLVRIAEIYAVLGEKEKAILLLKKSFSSRNPELLFIKVEPSFDKLRDDPRFQDMMRRIGLN